MRRQDLYDRVVEYFQKAMPVVRTELQYQDPFELLVAVMLSAQCTDKRINQVTPRLFEDYPNAESMSPATPDVIYEYIKSVSYPNSKAKHLVAMAQMLQKDFNGEVPHTMEELTKLPGVGRKTANVVMSVGFGAPAIAVDTHVFRVSNRLKLAVGDTPLAVEQGLMKAIPKDKWSAAHHWLIWHGRNVCKARKSLCNACPLAGVCPSCEPLA